MELHPEYYGFKKENYDEVLYFEYEKLIKEYYPKIKFSQWFLDKMDSSWTSNKKRFLDKLDIMEANFCTTDPSVLKFPKKKAIYYIPNPVDLSLEKLKNYEFKNLKIIGDITCDINGSVPTTIRSTSIAKPYYSIDIDSMKEIDLGTKGIAVMAVDNLPCELPKDASDDFGDELLKHVLSALFGEDPDKIIERGTETDFSGNLTDGFQYLQNYLEGKE